MELNSRISDSILREAEIKDTTVPYMVNKIESYTFSLNRAESFFDHRFDTTDILKSLTGLERGLNFFHNRHKPERQSDEPAQPEYRIGDAG